MNLSMLPDRYVVALTVWGESRNQPVEGQIAVACVIRNRHTARGGSWVSICLAPEQFSCFNEDDPNLVQIERATTALMSGVDTPDLAQALWVADGAISGAVKDNTKGANHYLVTTLLHSDPPSWAVNQPVLVSIGAHSFLKVA